MSRFSSLIVSQSVVDSLRYFFSHYSGDDLKYNDDTVATKIEIGTVNDFHKTAIETLPRILVDRGPIHIDGRHLDEDLAEEAGPFGNKGLTDKVSHLRFQGELSIMVESREEGACEVLADMVVNFIAKTAHLIARSYGYTNFARPIQMGSCAPFEDGEKQTSFRVVINIPYQAEDRWKLMNDSVKIKDVDTVVSSSS